MTDQHRLHEKQHLHVTVERRRHRRPLQLDAGRTADEPPVHHDGLDDDRERNRRDREEDAAHPQGQQADAKAERHADDRGGRDLHHQRRPRRLEQGHRRVDADAEEGVGAEIDVAGIAAEDAPGDRERDELQDHVAGKERIFVADDLRHRQHGDEEDGHAGPECDAVAMLRHRPSRPCGRMASTPSSIANEIAGAQEAPNIVSTMDSATPRMMAAISVPLMLPSPAMTTTQKVRPI